MRQGRRKSSRHQPASSDELVRTEKLDAIARVFETASHKVNNYLTPVLNYVFILKSSVSDDKSLSLLSRIEDGANRAKDIIQGLSAPARPAVDALERINLTPELARIIDAFVSAPQASGVNVTRRHVGKGIVMASKSGFDLLVSNILTNAVEAGAGEIRISCRRDGKNIIISITDNGQGMSKETLSLAFEPFFTTKPGHQGLGLYVCHHIARFFGGVVSCKSREGRESRFSIILPMA